MGSGGSEIGQGVPNQTPRGNPCNRLSARGRIFWNIEGLLLGVQEEKNIAISG